MVLLLLRCSCRTLVFVAGIVEDIAVGCSHRIAVAAVDDVDRHIGDRRSLGSRRLGMPL